MSALGMCRQLSIVRPCVRGGAANRAIYLREPRQTVSSRKGFRSQEVLGLTDSPIIDRRRIFWINS